jgi:hypothetical protein
MKVVNMIERAIDRHEASLCDINKSINKINVDLSVLISRHEELEKKTNEILVLANRHQNRGYGIIKAIRENITTFMAVTVPFLGIIGTILYEIGKYLRNLPAP